MTERAASNTDAYESINSSNQVPTCILFQNVASDMSHNCCRAHPRNFFSRNIFSKIPFREQFFFLVRIIIKKKIIAEESKTKNVANYRTTVVRPTCRTDSLSVRRCYFFFFFNNNFYCCCLPSGIFIMIVFFIFIIILINDLIIRNQNFRFLKFRFLFCRKRKCGPNLEISEIEKKKIK